MSLGQAEPAKCRARVHRLVFAFGRLTQHNAGGEAHLLHSRDAVQHGGAGLVPLTRNLFLIVQLFGISIWGFRA